MEKIIFFAIVVWSIFALSYAFPPPKPVKNPSTQKTEISKPGPNHPVGEKCKFYKSNFD